MDNPSPPPKPPFSLDARIKRLEERANTLELENIELRAQLSLLKVDAKDLEDQDRSGVIESEVPDTLPSHQALAQATS